MHSNDSTHFAINDISTPNDYSEMLIRFKISYSQNEFYWQVGQIPDMQGWILYIPVFISDIVILLNRIVPFLISNKVGFKIPVDKATHNDIKEGNLGEELFGKVICIYVQDQDTLSNLATQLIALMKGCKVTEMHSAVQLADGLYTRYGSFDPITTPNGTFLIDMQGNLVRDIYSIPYLVPKWVAWKFNGLGSPVPPILRNVIGSRYYIYNTIRNLPKGRIMHAFYKSGFLRTKQCIIKEGKQGMFSDEQGRDIVDRLKWQKLLHQNMSDKLSIPKYLDYFEENGNSYLIIEYIEGTKFERYIDNVFLFRSWFELNKSIRRGIIDHFIDIVEILISFHNLGYIHRDITLTNFMINKRSRIFLIDLELSFAINSCQPNPPFQVGTDGYMSPEQQEGSLLPTFEQDIFSLAALIMTVLVRVSPKKLIHIPPIELRSKLLFFTGSEIIADILVECLQSEPKDRPKLEKIKDQLIKFKNEEHSKLRTLNKQRVDLRLFIQNSINGFQLPFIVSNEGYWLSQDNRQQITRHIYIGFKKGISGILFLLSKLRGAGYDIGMLEYLFAKNWSFIKDRFLFAGKEVPKGLYSGSAGVALAIMESIESKLLPLDGEHIDYILNCLHDIPDGIDWANGMAGYGIVLIRCSKVLPADFVNERISILINRILSSQNSNGSWTFLIDNDSTPLTLIGFENGVAGVAYLLLEIGRIIDDSSIIESAVKSLHWIRRQAIKVDNGVVWPAHTDTKEGTVFFNGTVGVVLTFIKAYEVTGEIKFKEIAEQGLLSLPSEVITNEFGFSDGLSGIGQVYLEALRVFKDDRWQKRVDWIVDVFTQIVSMEENANYWIQNNEKTSCPDLMDGNGAIVHFLFQFINRDKSLNFYF